MGERRALVEGLKNTGPAVDPQAEKAFVFNREAAEVPQAAPPTATPTAAAALSRVPLSTRIRSDYSAALKRASLERQLAGVEPNTLQDILEQAVEPWLRSNGYLK
jgi:hypothetical protein